VKNGAYPLLHPSLGPAHAALGYLFFPAQAKNPVSIPAIGYSVLLASGYPDSENHNLFQP